MANGLASTESILLPVKEKKTRWNQNRFIRILNPFYQSTSHIRIVSDSIAMRVPLEGGRRSQRVSEAETVSVRMRKINRSCPTVLARLSCCEHRSLGFQSRTRVSETLDDDDDSKLFYDLPSKVTFTGFDTLTVFARYFVRLCVNAASFPPRTT